jgi:hypothetical protein
MPVNFLDDDILLWCLHSQLVHVLDHEVPVKQGRRITVALSLNEISTTQLETTLLVANFPFLPTAEPEFANVLGLGGRKSTPPGYIHRPAESIPWTRFLGSFLVYGQIFKDDIGGFFHRCGSLLHLLGY